LIEQILWVQCAAHDCDRAAYGRPFVHLGAMMARTGADLPENNALPPSQLRKNL